MLMKVWVPLQWREMPLEKDFSYRDWNSYLVCPCGMQRHITGFHQWVVSRRDLWHFQVKSFTKHMCLSRHFFHIWQLVAEDKEPGDNSKTTKWNKTRIWVMYKGKLLAKWKCALWTALWEAYYCDWAIAEFWVCWLQAAHVALSVAGEKKVPVLPPGKGRKSLSRWTLNYLHKTHSTLFPNLPFFTNQRWGWSEEWEW
jgi:hypothetical protein